MRPERKSPLVSHCQHFQLSSGCCSCLMLTARLQMVMGRSLGSTSGILKSKTGAESSGILIEWRAALIGVWRTFLDP